MFLITGILFFGFFALRILLDCFLFVYRHRRSRDQQNDTNPHLS